MGWNQAINVDMPFTVILDDPMANSFVQSLYAPDPDPQLHEESYERSFEQNEELGLNDIKTEDYAAKEEDAVVEEGKAEEPTA
jgi:zinc finger protein